MHWRGGVCGAGCGRFLVHAETWGRPMVLPLRFGRAPLARRPHIEGAADGILIVEGNIKGGEALVVDARVVGDVTAGRVSVGATGVVHGTVQGRSVSVAGTVHGAIIASQVQLDAGAIVFGRIEHLSLSIAETADFEGVSVRRPPGEDSTADAADAADVTDVTDEADEADMADAPPPREVADGEARVLAR